MTLLANLVRKDRFLHRRIAAADHGDLLAAEEVAVAGRARRDPVAHERALGRQSEQAGRRAGRDDQRLGLELLIARS